LLAFAWSFRNNPGTVIGDRLRELRAQEKLSQGDIEHRTGLLRCYVSRVENGHTIPAVETLEKFATRKTCINIWEETFPQHVQASRNLGTQPSTTAYLAVGLLQKGTSMEDVSLLRGHHRIAVMERHCASFTKGRQERLAASLRKTSA
jgi:transcriptional regulator with XRE-family HTH domain